MNSLIALVAFLVITVLAQAKNDAERDAKVEHEVYEKKSDVKPQEMVEMVHPLGCGQYIQKCGDGKCRVYVVCADLTTRQK